jgi:DNA-binding response OmpR family regulator
MRVAPARLAKLVVIADDDETTRIVVQRALTLAGHVAIPVDDGGEIWPILEREEVGVLILDLNMPGVNGWEVLRRLRTDCRFESSRPRVIIVSGQSDSASRDFALSLGADAFFSKPIDLQELTAAMGTRAGGRHPRKDRPLI